MGYRKLKGDDLFDGNRLLGPGQVLVINGSGVVEKIVADTDAGEGVEQLDGIICPGLINCHCHLELSHMHGNIPPGSGMTGFLLSVINSRNNAAENIQGSIVVADESMQREGIVAVGDICNTALTLRQKKASPVHYHNFVELAGFVPDVAQSRFSNALAVAHELSEAGPVSLVPHAPYSVSEELFEMINAHRPGSLLSIHSQENAGEEEFVKEAGGPFRELFSSLKTDIGFYRGRNIGSLPFTLSRIDAAHPLILVHNVNTSLADIEAARRRLDNLFWCLCPNANLYINGRLPDIRLFRSEGLKIVLGTDSLASNTSLSIVEEMKTLRRHFPDIALAEMLRWSTLNGADALQIGDRYGNFETGKRPGVAVLRNLEDGHLGDNSFAELVVPAGRDNVEVPQLN